MMVHGHTRESIDSIPAGDKLNILHFARTGVIPPISTAIHTYRMLSIIRALQGTVVSLAGGRGRQLSFKKAMPEIDIMFNPPGDSMDPNVVNSWLEDMARMMDAAEKHKEATDGQAQ